VIFHLLFFSLVALPIFSRPKAQAFDGMSVRDLARGYAEQLGSLFLNEPELALTPPGWFLRALSIDPDELIKGEAPGVSSVEAAEKAASREAVQVTAL
jgi:hypothetical protein